MNSVYYGKNFRSLGIFLAMLAISLFFSLQTPIFYGASNIVNIFQSSSINTLVALGMTLVIISGGIDLSVGSVGAYAAVIAADLMVHGVQTPVAVFLGVLVGLLAGLFNGFMVAVVKLQPFIVTLGSMSLFRALALIHTNGNPIFNLNNDYRVFIGAKVLGLPVPIVLTLLLVIVVWVLLHLTPYGELIMAIGGNETAARIAGVDVLLIKLVTYALSGVFAAVAAIVLMGRLGAAEPIAGNLWELNAIAAAALGGASLQGGRGSAIGTVWGALVLGSLINGLTLMNVQAFWQLAAVGVVILLAMVVERITKRRSV